jgi:hypothetical protein
MQYESFMADKHNYASGRFIILAGLAGGLAEMIWIMFYSAVTPLSTVEVARQITVTALPFAAHGQLAPALGIGIHLVLSIVLAAGFVGVLYDPLARRFGPRGIFFSGVTVLTVIWAVNFFVLLPVLNPAFPLLMPYAITLISKMLFGAAMSGVLVKTTKTGHSRIFTPLPVRTAGHQSIS